MRGAQSVYRAISILETFRADRPARTLAEIAQSVELTPPTAHRMLQALRSHDLVVFDEHRRQYTLGSGVMRMAGVVLDQDAVAVARTKVQELRDATGETASLHWRVQDTRVCLLEIVSDRPVHMASGVGNSYPLTAGAAGKSILAFLDAPDIDRVLAASPPRHTEDPRTELEQIRQAGYAFSTGETVPGCVALAAPILGAAGLPVAALNLTGPVGRADSIHTPALASRIRQMAAWITEELTHRD